MILAPGKVNISESDIEEWLWENPNEIEGILGYSGSTFTWLARQYKVPSGIIDLFGYLVHDSDKNPPQPNPVVIEVKNKPLVSSGIAQVCRYAADISIILQDVGEEHGLGIPISWLHPIKILIVPGPVDNTMLFEANAVGAKIHTFSVNYNVVLNGSTIWTDKANKEQEDTYKELSNQAEFTPFADFVRQEMLQYNKQYQNGEYRE